MTPTDIVMWLIGGVLLVMIFWGSVATLVKGVYSARQWIDFLIFGLAQGSIYALIAMGYTMVYGVLRMINFAHSEVFMAGPFIGYFVAGAMDQAGAVICVSRNGTILGKAVSSGATDRVACDPPLEADDAVLVVVAGESNRIPEQPAFGDVGPARSYPTSFPCIPCRGHL